ncbi:ADP-ribose glycohydrolase MACROD1 isoform X2 [Engraulis encrasicolus]|uniref:ADP-ribose glycohydrolase MACROD1 isoform X2 n=1 Tax=Engraulis encrasicolus TaxID=184585 RepID=UPI002FCFCCEA
MALHVSKLTTRLPTPGSFGLRSVLGTRLPFTGPTFTDIRCAAGRRTLHLLVRQASDSWSAAKSLLLNSELGYYRCAVGRLGKFTAAGSKAFHHTSSSTTSNWTSRSRYQVAFSVLGVSVGAMATLHTTTMLAMSETPEIVTDWQKAKDDFLNETLEERRARCKGSVPLDEIPVWEAVKPVVEPKEVVNKKISLFQGDITKLEIDAIVNAANKSLLGGGGVDGAIHRTAGPMLKKECATLNGCETGEAKITGGYALPAKYVIHTVGPIAFGGVTDKERNALRDCYLNCLQTAVENKLRTVAFPCISTGVYGYPPKEAVDVALDTVRKFLEQYHDKLDRVIFCVFLETDKELYRLNIPRYFPAESPEPGSAVKSKL